MLQLRGISLDTLRKFVSDTSHSHSHSHSQHQSHDLSSSTNTITSTNITTSTTSTSTSSLTSTTTPSITDVSTSTLVSNISPDTIDFSDINPRLSTMTICGHFGTILDIHKIRDTIPIQSYWSHQQGIVLAEGYNDTGTIIRRGNARRYIMKKEFTKPFLNCTTLYIRIFDEETHETKEPSIKLFKNGGYQMTGIRTPIQANHAIMTAKELILTHCSDAIGNPEVFRELTKDTLDIKVCMMVSDMTIPYTIHREEVQKLIAERTRLVSSFESTTYQGVNIKYFWNPDSPHRDGICRCPVHCNGKNTPCRRITIAPFQTGKIIITGGSLTEKEIREAAHWILGFLKEHSRQTLSPPRRDLRRKRNAFFCPNPFRSGENRILKIRPERIILNHSLHSILNNQRRIDE
jgi:hypothetical protein